MELVGLSHVILAWNRMPYAALCCNAARPTRLLDESWISHFKSDDHHCGKADFAACMHQISACAVHGEPAGRWQCVHALQSVMQQDSDL